MVEHFGWRRTRCLTIYVVSTFLSACTPNPRSEIAAIATAAMEEAVKDAPGKRLCVDRTLVPWQPPGKVQRVDPPAPPGFEGLYRAPAYRGGGALKGDGVGGVAIRSGGGCLDLRGPLIVGDRAMIEVHLPGVGWNVWERRTDGDWRVVMTTTSQYPP